MGHKDMQMIFGVRQKVDPGLRVAGRVSAGIRLEQRVK
jgi:hypothetical protein